MNNNNMKKSIKIAALSFVLGFLVLSAQAQQKFGHINSSDLLQSMPEMKVADAAFQTYAKAKQSALEQMDAERQKKIVSYQEKYKSLSEANKETLAELNAGQVDIVIGTHKLLQPSIQFNDLGLLVIDEEQRFGVKQKERL